MPIKPENKARYPKDWKQIRARILERATFRCEGSPLWPDCRVENYAQHPVTGSKVVLTIAHLDHTPENCADDNLRAWCQRCHLAYDAQHHAINAAATRRKGKAVADLFEVNS
jgi:5-methylcytosine-specific restriction endonuclease McrA